MLSKKNIQGRLRKVEPTEQRFSIRKFTVGAASVLIGMAFMGMSNGQTAHAATVEKTPVVATAKTDNASTAEKLESAKEDAVKSAATDQTAGSQQATQSSAATENSAASNDIKSNANQNSEVKSGDASLANQSSAAEATKAKSEAATPSAQSEENGKSVEETTQNQNGGVKASTDSNSEAVTTKSATPASSAKADSSATADSTAKASSAAAKKSVVPTGDAAAKLAEKYGKKAASTATQTQSADTWDALASELNDPNVGTINLTKDITVTNDTSSAIKKPNPVVAPHKLQLTANDISRAVTINGNGHTIDFGDNYLTFSTEGAAGLVKGNRSKNSPWNVTFNDITINSNVATPIDFEGNSAAKGDNENDTVTYNNATIEIKNGALIDSGNVNVVLTGNNTITTDDVKNKATFIANTVNVASGTTTINNASTNGTIGASTGGQSAGVNTIVVNPQDDDANGNPVDSLTVAEGATLNINAKSTDMRGIVTDDFKTGTITVNGTLNEDMQNGHSSAILAGNLNIGKTGAVNITTKQDNEADGKENAWTNGVATYNGYHYGVIGLGVGKLASVGNGKRSLIDNGSLTIVRKDVPASNKADGKVWAPLIVFGAGADNEIAPGNFTLSVGEGATLDLQDGAVYQAPMANMGNYSNAPALGMISMFGKAASDTIDLTKPAYVNLQRTSSQTGTLLRLEGTNSNVVQMNGLTPGGTPLSQWDEGNYTDNPSDTWRITNFTGHSASGNDAIKGFEGLQDKGMSRQVLGSNSAVTMTMDKKGNVVYTRNSTGQVVNPSNGSTAEEVELNNFLNNFNFWTPQRISFGSKAIIKKPAYNPTTVEQGKTETVSPAYPLTAPETATDDQMKVTYSKADDTPAWVTVDENTGVLTLAPTTDNSKVGMYNVPVVVTNTDETDSGKTTTNTVFAPVYVTNGNEQVNWGKDKDGNYTGAVVVTTDPSALKAHETTANSSVLNASDAVKSIQEYQMDTDTTVDTKPTEIAKNATGVTISWAKDPSTVVPTATASENIDGTVDVTFATDSKPFTDGVLGQDTDTPEPYTSASKMSIPTAGATAKDVEAPVDVKAGEALTVDQFNALVNNNIPTDQEASYAWQTSPVKGKDATIRITFKDDDANGQPTYLDVNIPAKNLNVPSDADDYQPSYKTTDVKQGGTVTTDAPTYTNTDGKDVTAPEGTKYSIPDGTTFPGDATATVDPDTGKVTITTTDQTPAGLIDVPVTVTYPDNSTETVYAPIMVNGTTFIGTDYTVTVFSDLKNLHETTDNSMNPDAKNVITKVVYWNNKDLANGKNLDGTSVDLTKGVTVEWTNEPNTVVSQASMSATLPGTGTPTVSSTNPALKISFANDSQLVQQVGKYLNLNDDYGWSQTVQWYGGKVTMQGAAPVEDAASKKLEVTPAKAGDALTDAEKALIDTTNLDKLTANKPVSYTWANDLKAGDTQGTVKITFSDTDKDGNPTYLNVVLPAGSLDVKDPNAQSTVTINYVNNDDHNDIIKSTPVTGKVGEKTNITQDSINAGVPENWQVVGNQTLDVPTTFGSNDSTLTVYVEHKTENVPVDKNNKDTYREVTQTIVSVNPTTGDKTNVRTTTVSFQRTGVKDLVTGKTTWNAWVGSEGSKTVDGVTTYEIPAYTITPVKGYDSYVNGTKATEVAAVTVNPDSSNITDTITYVKQGSTETDADKYTPDGQDVHTTVGKEPSAEDGISNTKDMPEGTKYTWKETPDVSKEGTVPATVVVTYPDNSTDEVPVNVIVSKDNTKPSTETDADKYTPEGQDVHTTVGKEPSAEDGISNTKDMPEGTKYTWKETPDVSKAGTVPATVVVTYPDNSTDEVPVNVIVSTPASHTTENATGTPIVTEKGKMPDPSEGIGNKGDLPEGTKYTWTNGEPDVNKIGESPVTITVHYPDGKTQDVPTTIIVTGTEKPGDPGITNPNDPVYSDLFKTVTRTIITDTPNSDGTTTESENPQKVVFGRTKTVTNDNGKAKTTYSDYTIYNTDTNKLTNDKTGTFNKVTVPQHDGYVSEVNGTKATEVPAETVTAETPNSTVTISYAKADSDAAKYDPEGQDINTNKGVTPNPEDGIKNKNDLPEGTKYTWTNPDQVKNDVDKPGSHSETIKVTYPDGSTDEVPVHVVVSNPSTDADKYTPEGQPVTTNKGEVPDAKKGIKNTGDMPEGTKYAWTDPDQVKKDVETTGDHTESITVTYPDGSKDTVDVPVTVKENATDADKNTPEPQPIDTPQGQVPDPDKGIKNKDDLPDGTKYTWSDPDKVKDDVNKPGSHDETVNVTYPDGSKDTVTVKVVVSPEGQPITTPEGNVPDASEGIKNPEDLPDGTKVEWNDPDQVKKDVDTVGDHDETIKVTYPDGSSTTITVPVTVTNPDNGGNSGNVTTDPTPIPQDVHTTVGNVPDASEGISNTGDMPAGTTYTWKTTPDVSTEGTHTGVVSVNYPDGSSVDVPVTVIVGKDNTTNTGDNNKDTKPEPQPITTDQGKLPDPSEGIKNKDDMPEGTKYTWKETPDVSTEGTHKVTIIVTYPDGKTAEVTTTITVVKSGAETGTTTGNGSGNNGGNGSANMSGNNGSGSNSGVVTESGVTTGTNSAEANSGNGNGTAKAATKGNQEGQLPQTGASDSSKAGIFGLALAAIAGFFGIAGDRKRKNN